MATSRRTYDSGRREDEDADHVRRFVVGGGSGLIAGDAISDVGNDRQRRRSSSEGSEAALLSRPSEGSATAAMDTARSGEGDGRANGGLLGWTRLLYAPLEWFFRSPEDLSAESQVRRLQQRFEERYGAARVPPLQACSYTTALERSREQFRLLVVYLHSEEHQDADRFCRCVFDSCTGHYLLSAGCKTGNRATVLSGEASAKLARFSTSPVVVFTHCYGFFS